MPHCDSCLVALNHEHLNLAMNALACSPADSKYLFNCYNCDAVLTTVADNFIYYLLHQDTTREEIGRW